MAAKKKSRTYSLFKITFRKLKEIKELKWETNIDTCKTKEGHKADSKRRRKRISDVYGYYCCFKLCFYEGKKYPI